MLSGKVTIETLAFAVNERLGLSHRDALGLVKLVVGEIVAELSRGNNVYIYRFGSLQLRRRHGRRTKDPYRGEPTKVPDYNTVVFRPSLGFEKLLNLTAQARNG